MAFGSGPEGAALASGVPSSKQKFSDGSVYVRLQVGQRFIGDGTDYRKRSAHLKHQSIHRFRRLGFLCNLWMDLNELKR